MKILDSNLNKVQDKEYEYKIDKIHNLVINFLIARGINEEFINELNSKKNDLIIEKVNFANKNYSVFYNDGLKNLKIPDAGAFATYFSQKFDGEKWIFEPCIVVPGTESNHYLLHEYLHYLSFLKEIKLDNDRLIYDNGGFQFTVYNDRDEVVDRSFSNSFLTEGITEYMACKIDNSLPEIYLFNTIVVELLCINNNNELINAYFSKDYKDILTYSNNFEKVTGKNFDLIFNNEKYGYSISLEKMYEIIKSIMLYDINSLNKMDNIDIIQNEIVNILYKYEDKIKFYFDNNFDYEDLFLYLGEIVDKKTNSLNNIKLY